MMKPMIWLVLIVTGLLLGSFVNALVQRLHAQTKPAPRGKAKKSKIAAEDLSIVKGRSMCLSCGHPLAARDLIPVVSWLSLRGKCRYCGAKFPDTPVAELLVPLLFVVSYVFWPLALGSGLDWTIFGLWLACTVAFVALGLYDMRWYILPDRIVLPLAVLALVYRLLLALMQHDVWQSTLLSGWWGLLVLAGLFFVLFQVSNGNWIGGGDVKLAVPLGLLSGGPLLAVLLLFIASVTGTLSAVPQLVTGKAGRGSHLPFGPFLILGCLVAVLFGHPILDWYTSLFRI